MKKLALTAGLLLSTLSFADVDYSRCNHLGMGFGNGMLDNDGKLVPAMGMTITDVKTVGSVQTYKLKGQMASFNGHVTNHESEISITRDRSGRVTKVKLGGEKPSQTMIDMYKSYTSPTGMYYQTGAYGSSTPQPMISVGSESVSLDQLTNEQAETAGISKSLTEYRKLQGERRKDKATLRKMKDHYAKINEVADYQFPFGQENEFEVQDGVCMMKSVSQRTYSTKTKEVTTQLMNSKESCEEIKKLHKKYEPKLNECQTVSETLNKEYWDTFGTQLVQSPYGMGGVVGGVAGGGAGGVVGGSMGGGYGYGYGFGGYGMTISGPIQVQLWTCENYYGVQPVPGFGTTGGWGQAPESNAQKQ